LAEDLGDFGEVLVDICVVEFDIVDDQDLGQVVEKLSPFGKEGTVVFVPFDNEVLTLAKAVGTVEILR